MKGEKQSALRKLVSTMGSGVDDLKRRKMFVFFMTDGCDTCNSEYEVRTPSVTGLLS